MGTTESTEQVMAALLTDARRHARGSPVDVEASAVDDMVLVCVEDRGPGVPTLLQAHVFERHMQAVSNDGSGRACSSPAG